jgi:hypothetical protein
MKIQLIINNSKNGKVSYIKIKLTNSVALVRERNLPNEQPPLVGEVSANFCG